MFVPGYGYDPGGKVLAVQDWCPEFRTPEYPSVLLFGNEGESGEWLAAHSRVMYTAVNQQTDRDSDKVEDEDPAPEVVLWAPQIYLSLSYPHLFTCKCIQNTEADTPPTF